MTFDYEHGYGKKGLELRPGVLQPTPALGADGMRQYSKESWERVLAAVSRMSHVGDSGLQILGQIEQSGFDQAIQSIEHIKRVLPERKKVSRFQWATALRVALEGTASSYLSKAHLACALSEMGYKVCYKNSQYFRTDYPCGQVLKEFGRIWRPDYGFC